MMTSYLRLGFHHVHGFNVWLLATLISNSDKCDPWNQSEEADTFGASGSRGNRANTAWGILSSPLLRPGPRAGTVETASRDHLMVTTRCSNTDTPDVVWVPFVSIGSHLSSTSNNSHSSDLLGLVYYPADFVEGFWCSGVLRFNASWAPMTLSADVHHFIWSHEGENILIKMELSDRKNFFLEVIRFFCIAFI